MLGGRAGMFMNEEQGWGWGWVGEGRGILENDPSPGKHGSCVILVSGLSPSPPPLGGGERPETGIIYDCRPAAGGPPPGWYGMVPHSLGLWGCADWGGLAGLIQNMKQLQCSKTIRGEIG